MRIADKKLSSRTPAPVDAGYQAGEDLDPHLPQADPLEAWRSRRDSYRLVSPANRRRLTVIVVGTGLAGSGAAATLGRLGYRVECFSLHDSPRRAHSVADVAAVNRSGFCEHLVRRQIGRASCRERV